MKCWPLFLLLLLPLTAGAQDSVDTYGKTEADILQMGMSSWYDFYTSKAGESTAAMSSAYGIYTDVAGKRNDKIIASHPSLKARSKRLRSLLIDFGSQSIAISSDKTGGGTMWVPVGSEMTAEVEDTLNLILPKPKYSRGHPYVYRTKNEPPDLDVDSSRSENSKARAEFVQIKSSILAFHRDKSNSDIFKYDVAVQALSKMQRDYAHIVSIVKGMKRWESDILLNFCYKWAKNASDKEGA
jgi:hypothetical protein